MKVLGRYFKSRFLITYKDLINLRNFALTGDKKEFNKKLNEILHEKYLGQSEEKLSDDIKKLNFEEKEDFSKIDFHFESIFNKYDKICDQSSLPEEIYCDYHKNFVNDLPKENLLNWLISNCEECKSNIKNYFEELEREKEKLRIKQEKEELLKSSSKFKNLRIVKPPED